MILKVSMVTFRNMHYTSTSNYAVPELSNADTGSLNETLFTLTPEIFSGVGKYMIRTLSSSNTGVFIHTLGSTVFTRYGVQIKHSMTNVT